MAEQDKLSLCFLGTGASDATWGLPGSADMPVKDVRRNVSLHVAPDLQIDFNAHTPEALDAFGVEKDSIRYLLISHGHYDHYQPAEILRFAESLPHPLEVYGNVMVGDGLGFCRDHTFDRASGPFVSGQRPLNIKMSVLATYSAVRVGDFTVTPVPANHFTNQPYTTMEQQALNFVIEREGKTLFYGLDSSCLLPGVAEALSHFLFNAAIFDVTLGPRQIDPLKSGHLNWKMLDETVAEFREAGCVTDDTAIVASHLSTEHVGPYDQVAGTLADRGITMAYDGMRLVC